MTDPMTVLVTGLAALLGATVVITSAAVILGKRRAFTATAIYAAFVALLVVAAFWLNSR